MDFQLVIRSDRRQVLGSDKDKLTVLHFASHMNEIRHGQFTSFRVQKDVEFVHEPKGRFQLFAQSQKQTNGRKTTFSTTVKIIKTRNAYERV